MIALIVGMPSGGTYNFTELAADTLRSIAPVRKLSLVRAPVAGGPLTVAQFCEQRGVSLTIGCMSRIGRKASALSRAAGLTIGRAVEAFGEVSAYDADVLAQAFAFIEASKH